MKKVGSVLWGIVLIAAGVIWALNEFNVTNINVFFDGWWTLFITHQSAPAWRHEQPAPAFLPW